jgi:hypothetical protein
MSYTSVFGGSTIYPSDVSYLALPLAADSPLEWPLESSGTEPPAARIIDVTPTASGFSVIMPDATQTGAGQTILFNNLSGSYSFFVKDFTGNTLATVGFGEQWQVYLAVTTTAAGTWRVFRYGASTASVQPSALAGFGLTVTGSTLSQATPVTSFSTSGLTLASSNRAGTFVWTGPGAGTLNLPAAASVGNNYFILAHNAGGGDLTVDPAGTEVINGAPSLTFRPGDSATVIADGTQWYTVGFGQDAVFAFDYTSISVTGGNYTLSGSELNRIAYKFVGTLTSDLYVIIPATVQQYWITNATTGAFNFYVRTAGGIPTQVNQGAKGIYYCDGADVILASDPTVFSLPVNVSQGGTGATSASAARLNLGITAFADPIVTATSGASVRSTIGAAASGANSDITALSGLTTAISAPQGGTGLSSYAVGDLLYASTTSALARLADVATGNVLISGGVGVAPAWGKVGLTTHVSGVLPVANGGTGAATLTGYVKGAGTSAMTASATIPASDLSGTLSVANGGTGATTATTARTNLGAAASGANTDITALNQDVTVTATGTIAANTIGYRGLPQNTQSGAYTFALPDAGKHIYSTNTGAQAITVPTNASVAIPVGTAISVVNNGTTAISFTTTGTTVYKAGTSTAWASGGTLAVRGMATWLKVATDTWFVSGSGLS